MASLCHVWPPLQGRAAPPLNRAPRDFTLAPLQTAKEYAKYDADPAKYFRKLPCAHSRTKAPYSVDVGYEAFLAPELFFSPEIYSSEWTKPLPEVRDGEPDSHRKV